MHETNGKASPPTISHPLELVTPPAGREEPRQRWLRALRHGQPSVVKFGSGNSQSSVSPGCNGSRLIGQNRFDRFRATSFGDLSLTGLTHFDPREPISIHFCS
jgi:hypothetical protein